MADLADGDEDGRDEDDMAEGAGDASLEGLRIELRDADAHLSWSARGGAEEHANLG